MVIIALHQMYRCRAGLLQIGKSPGPPWWPSGHEFSHKMLPRLIATFRSTCSAIIFTLEYGHMLAVARRQGVI